MGDDDGDGIANYLDAIPASHVLQEIGSHASSHLIEAGPGVGLRLGGVSFQAGSGGAHVDAATISSYMDSAMDSVPNVGGYFDFEVTDLPELGQSVRIVIPQWAPIPSSAVYRKLMPADWQNFHENTHNQLASTQGEEGYCPPPGDAAYTSGLTEGHWCVQLTIEDGGLNDADGERNRTILDPGVVGQATETEVATPEHNSGGGAAVAVGQPGLS